MPSPRLLWDWGTAYDFFVSLDVLHNPAQFGVRGTWAAGVRARLPAEARETLEQSHDLKTVPLAWIHRLPEPKDGAAVLWVLGKIPPAERLLALTLPYAQPPADAGRVVLTGVAARGSWGEEDRRALRACFQDEWKRHGGDRPPSSQKLARILEAWAHAEAFGERLLSALRSYHEAFFAEEERRITPALRQAVERAQERAEQLALPDLLEELSQGLRFDETPGLVELVLVPSFWCTPWMYYEETGPGREIRLFGARPADASLIPGEMVPDALLRALEALADPSRLRLLRYLTAESLSPAELARRLRLRLPTVLHHLDALRRAGLVQLTLGEAKEPKRYAARPEAVRAVFDSLSGFLEKSG